MNRLSLLVLALAAATGVSVGNLYLMAPTMLPSLVTRAQSASVAVTVFKMDQETGEMKSLGAGSGVRVRQGAILTCAHVTATDYLDVRYADGSHEHVKAVLRHKQDDLAVLVVEKATGRIARLSMNVRAGMPVIIIGNPGPFEAVATFGIISLLEPIGLTDAIINGGNSGGGMFDMSGNLIGIMRATISEPSGGRGGYSVFIPPFKIRAIMTRYDRLVREGKLNG